MRSDSLYKEYTINHAIFNNELLMFYTVNYWDYFIVLLYHPILKCLFRK